MVAADSWTETVRVGERYLFCRTFLEMPWLIHGFSIRAAADGSGRNLGLHVGDDPAAVREARRRFLAGLGLDPANLIAASQVHSCDVAVVGPNRRGAGADDYETAVPRTDGLATAVPGLVLSVFYADCAPVLLVDPGVRAVAAVHAGWRGSVAGIAARAIQIMREEFKADPRRMSAAIGPAIGPCCYEVGAEVAAAVPPAARPEVMRDRDGKAFLDLPALNAWWLRQCGLPAAAVHAAGQCTFCGADRFFSHRREQGRAGRMMAVIAVADTT